MELEQIHKLQALTPRLQFFHIEKATLANPPEKSQNELKYCSLTLPK